MKSGVIGGCADRAADAVGAEIGSAHGMCVRRSPRRAVRGLSARPGRGLPDLQGLDHRRDVVHAHDRAPRAAPRAATRRRCGVERAAARPSARRRRRRDAGEPRQRRLARPAGEQRQAEREQLVLARQQLEVLRRRLAEADARIDDDALRAPRPPPRPRRRARARKAPISPTTIVVVGLALHRPRRAAHVHQADAAAGCAATTSSAPGRAQRADVVDDVGAEIQRGAHHLGLGGVDRDRRDRGGPPRAAPAAPAPARSRRSTGSAPGRLDSPPRSSMSAPSASSRSQCASARAGVRRRVAVGERVGREVDDAHHPRRGEVDLEAAWSSSASRPE